jgi:hypothetical protein
MHELRCAISSNISRNVNIFEIPLSHTLTDFLRRALYLLNVTFTQKRCYFSGNAYTIRLLDGALSYMMVTCSNPHGGINFSIYLILPTVFTSYEYQKIFPVSKARPVRKADSLTSMSSLYENCVVLNISQTCGLCRNIFILFYRVYIGS